MRKKLWKKCNFYFNRLKYNRKHRLRTKYMIYDDLRTKNVGQRNSFAVWKELLIFIMYKYTNVLYGNSECSPVLSGLYKVPHPLPPLGKKFIKSVGEEYRVVQRRRKYHDCWEEYNVKKVKGQAIIFRFPLIVRLLGSESW